MVMFTTVVSHDLGIINRLILTFPKCGNTVMTMVGNLQLSKSQLKCFELSRK